MAVNFPPNTGVFQFSQGNYIVRIDYDASGNAIYQGWAQPGTATSALFWRLVKNTYDGSDRFTASGFPQDVNGNPSCGFAFAWDSRTSYSYS